MSSGQLPSDFTNEIRALERSILKDKPTDILQHCANFFLRRLESQRHEYLLSQRHSSGSESTYFGSNPFGASGGSGGAAMSGDRSGPLGGIHEEEEHDLASPMASNFPSSGAREASPSSNSEGGFGNFGGFAFGGSSGGSRSGPPPSASSGEASQSVPNNYNVNRRVSVSAESLAPTSADDTNWKAPSFPKTADQNKRLQEAVAQNFLFSHLDDDQSALVLGALQEKKIPAKDIKVIVQGDAGDYFYVVESGSFDIYVSSTGKMEDGPDGMGKKVASSGPGQSFGELALMYNAPRAATVVSTESSVLWQLDRVTFRRILMDSAFQRRRMYESFLEEVPLLSPLNTYERSKIADALETTKYPPGTTIIKEGDVGDKFYILEAGDAAATKRGSDKELKAYKKGDYFGELALLNDKPRAASVISKTDVKVAWLDKHAFQRLLGPVESMMRRDDPSKREDSTDPLR